MIVVLYIIALIFAFGGSPDTTLFLLFVGIPISALAIWMTVKIIQPLFYLIFSSIGDLSGGSAKTL